MKLLVVNKQNPCDSCYMKWRSVPTWLWGRRISNYVFILVEGEEHKELVIRECEVSAIEKQLKEIFE